MPVPISVVIPTYNRCALIGETIAAIQAQTLAPVDIVIIDDGSTDDTAATVAAIGDNRIRYHPITNSGELVARNTGLRLATAPFAAFCDSDDLWRPTYLERVAALWTERPGLRATYGNFAIVRDGVWQPGAKFDDAPPGFWDRVERLNDWAGVLEPGFIDLIVHFQPFFPSAMAVDRERFLADGGWDEAVTGIVGCDFATTLAVAERGQVGVLFEPLVGVRKHAQNFSGNIERMNLGDARVLEYALGARPGLRPFEDQIRRAINGRRRDALGHAFARRDFAQVREIARQITPADWTDRAKIAIAYAAAAVERVTGRPR